MSQNTTSILFLFIIAIVMIYFMMPSSIAIPFRQSLLTPNLLHTSMPPHMVAASTARRPIVENMSVSAKVDKNALAKSDMVSLQYETEPAETVVVIDAVAPRKVNRKVVRVSQIPRNNGLQFNPIVKARFYDKETGDNLGDRFGAIAG